MFWGRRPGDGSRLIVVCKRLRRVDDGPYVVEPLYPLVRFGIFPVGLRFLRAQPAPAHLDIACLDYAVWGLSAGHHLTNVLLHAINTFLVVLIVKLLGVDMSGRRSDGPNVLIVAEQPASRSASIPHVESVAWVAERKDLLCGLFFLLSILSYISYVSYRTYKTYFLALGFFILALLSKPMAVTLPVVLLILDWYPLDRLRSWNALRTAVVEKLPFLACGLISSVLTILAQANRSAEFVPVRPGCSWRSTRCSPISAKCCGPRT
jgi:hypothetical protein